MLQLFHAIKTWFCTTKLTNYQYVKTKRSVVYHIRLLNTVYVNGCPIDDYTDGVCGVKVSLISWYGIGNKPTDMPVCKKCLAWLKKRNLRLE